MKVLAFDFGASSGRAILGIYKNGSLQMEEIHRFPNDPVMVNGTFYWDILRLFHETKQSITKCVTLGHSDIESVGIDTWGIDFGLLDEDGYLLENPVHYRDKRTEDVMEKVFEEVDKQRVYESTGIQNMNINSLFQLCSLKYNRPELLKRAKTLLFTPDLLAYFLTGEKHVEYTIASTSQFINAKTRDYDKQLLKDLEIDISIFPSIIMPGQSYGKLSQELADELGVKQFEVIAVATHDTASAITAAPMKKNEKSFYISSGTWSLLGTELDEPVINQQSFENEIANEGGANNKICFLKNISGLWLLQETRRQWNREGNDISFKDIDKMLENETSANIYIDPSHPSFVASGNMPKRINAFLEKTNQQIPKTKGQTALCILESLALAYRYYIETMEDILGYKAETIHIIGGGVKDKNLCQFTANSTGKKVTAGPVEATAIGNINIQLIAKGQIESIEKARETIEDVDVYNPQDLGTWNKKYEEFLKIRGLDNV